ncbi:uncharacterized protein [Blastocystis hominis]|uniref:Thioredoxin domain-containing protein n=1 Tax=Blastocystis hominis TaxID=12968 RepID=D8M1G4_BLAHO|nr:uncharacterized protein [Blastocystis hominis]CBK21903.2 unnamed protein product [Blastocystis hominis]|eukprot:XP_012895951.1 uncharacterized protein [Blastocystis hominis]
MNTNIDYLAAKYNGYVDCTKEKALCDKYQVHYFPTIKYVISNYVHDYFGRTSLRSLIEMCDSLNPESITMISDDATYTSFIHSSQVVFLCVYDSSPFGEQLYSHFQNVSQYLLLYAVSFLFPFFNPQTFGATHDPLQILPPIQPPYVVRIEGDEDPLYYRSQNVTRDELFNWIRSLSLPLLPEYRGRAYNDIVRSGKRTLLFALDSAALIDNEQIAHLKQVVRSLPVSVDSFESE